MRKGYKKTYSKTNRKVARHGGTFYYDSSNDKTWQKGKSASHAQRNIHRRTTYRNVTFHKEGPLTHSTTHVAGYKPKVTVGRNQHGQKFRSVHSEDVVNRTLEINYKKAGMYAGGAAAAGTGAYLARKHFKNRKQQDRDNSVTNQRRKRLRRRGKAV